VQTHRSLTLYCCFSSVSFVICRSNVEERKPQYLHTEFSYFDVHSTDLYMRVTKEALSPYRESSVVILIFPFAGLWISKKNLTNIFPIGSGQAISIRFLFYWRF